MSILFRTFVVQKKKNNNNPLSPTAPSDKPHNMTITEMQIEALRKVQSEISKRAARMEEALYNDTAMEILLQSTGIRFDRLYEKRHEMMHKVRTMWDICGLIEKQINQLKNN